MGYFLFVATLFLSNLSKRQFYGQLKKPPIKLDMFKSTCPILPCGQIDQISKWLFFV
jgi:hypothetical protein